MMDELSRARAERLATIREIIESCEGDPIHIDTVTEVLVEALRIMGDEPDVVRPLDQEGERVLCALGTIVSALRDLAWYLAQSENPGTRQRKLRELPERIQRLIEEAIHPRLDLMPREQVARVMLESTRWAFLIWTPGEQLAMLRLLEMAAEGRYIPKADRERARQLLERYRATLPMGRRIYTARSTTEGGESHGQAG